MFQARPRENTDCLIAYNVFPVRGGVGVANDVIAAVDGHAMGSLHAIGLQYGQQLAHQRAVGVAERSEVLGLRAQGHEMPIEISFSELTLDGAHHFGGFLRHHTPQAGRAGAARSQGRPGTPCRRAHGSADHDPLLC